MLQKIWMLLIIAVLSNAFPLNEDELENPMENPDLFGGDMEDVDIDDMVNKNGVVRSYQTWPKGIIPYIIESSLDNEHGDLIREQMKVIESQTCIRFVPRTDEEDYINILVKKGCSAVVGRKGGPQHVSLSKGCYHPGTIIHELTHAIGFYHEQNRSDRDDWLIIHMENVKPGAEKQFFKFEPHKNRIFNDFSYESIMLYGEYMFSKKPGVLKTMEAKQKGITLPDIRHWTKYREPDIYRIKKMYNC